MKSSKGNSDNIYINRVITNIRRLINDAEFNTNSGRKLTGLFLYITATEELYFKLLNVNEVRTTKIPNHREKLGVINNRIKEVSKGLKNFEPMRVIMADFVKKVVQAKLDYKQTEDDYLRLVKIKEQIDKAKNATEILDSIDGNEIVNETLHGFVSTIERTYSDVVRNNCLYADERHEPLTAEEIEAQINMYRGILEKSGDYIREIESKIDVKS